MIEAAAQNWGYKKDNLWSSIAGSTMGAFQTEDEMYDDALFRSYEYPGQAQDVTVVVSCDLEGANSDQKNQCQPKKVLWRSNPLIDYFNNVWKNFIIYEGLEDYSGSPGESVTTLLTIPNLLSRRTDDEANTYKGVYIPKYKKNVIFTKTLEFKTSELPRWKPSAIIGKRNFEEDDVQ